MGVIINIIKTSGIITLDKSLRVGHNIQDNPMIKEENPKVEGGAKPKLGAPK